MAKSRGITPQSEDFSAWYNEIVYRADLADLSPVRGSMVIKPYGYALWENVQANLDRMFKETGHQNLYFPLLIPVSFFAREAQHVEGFSPELAVVTHAGGKELDEPLAIRPTSETIVGEMYSKWVQSWRDLPILINQWGNVVRWEKVTRFFLRTTEFLWQEGHTAHATAEEAQEETLKMLGVYKDFLEEDLGIPVITGVKTEKEKFAGAVCTYAVEALMSDGRALQAGTSHNLGQNFAKAFDIQFEDKNQEIQHAWSPSWGMTTRTIGSLVMSHGDDNGLRLPPRVAPYHVVIVPIKAGNYEEEVLPAARQLEDLLRTAGLRVYLDDREEYTPGWKYNEWEMRGVPLRAEIGPRDVKNKQTVLVRRDTRDKTFVPIDHVPAAAATLLDDIQTSMLTTAREFMETNTRPVEDFDAFREIMSGPRGFLKANWCGDRELEVEIQQETSATIRCLLTDEEPTGPCFYTGKPATQVAIFAKAY